MTQAGEFFLSESIQMRGKYAGKFTIRKQRKHQQGRNQQIRLRGACAGRIEATRTPALQGRFRGNVPREETTWGKTTPTRSGFSGWLEPVACRGGNGRFGLRHAEGAQCRVQLPVVSSKLREVGIGASPPGRSSGQVGRRGCSVAAGCNIRLGPIRMVWVRHLRRDRGGGERSFGGASPKFPPRGREAQGSVPSFRKAAGGVLRSKGGGRIGMWGHARGL